MAVGIGMRAIDLQKFMMVAREFGVIILVRNTNKDSLKYIGKPGFYPKPAVCKAKTADQNPRPIGATTLRTYDVAGLVVHPAFQPEAYKPAKRANAQKYWDDTMKTLSPTLVHAHVDPYDPKDRSVWGVERTGVKAPRWKWKVDVDLNSPRFGCLQLNDGRGWCYIHGDYDLKDVIVESRDETNITYGTNITHKQKIDGVPNNIPFLFTIKYEDIRVRLNALIGSEMVQHGAEAQFAWHGEDDPITAAFPDWTHKVFYDAVTVQLWYEQIKRKVLAKMPADKDYTRKNVIRL